jgi:cell division protein FtsZ
MSEMGMAMMGTGEASGENRAIEAAEKAISSPLLEDISIHGARGVLINVTASSDVTLQEVNEAAELVHAEAHEDANIIWGMVIDPTMSDRVRVTVIATGFGENKEDANTVSVSPVSAGAPQVGLSAGALGKTGSASKEAEKLEIPTFARKNKDSGAEFIKLKKLSVLSSSEDEEKYEIPTFLRKQVD